VLKLLHPHVALVVVSDRLLRLRTKPKDALLVVQSLGDVTSGRMQVSGGTEIARRQVIQISEITASSFTKKKKKARGRGFGRA
jgi:hypothetical protein